jgi:hypothetical protein
MIPYKLITTCVLIVCLTALSGCVIGRSTGGRSYDLDDGSRDGGNYRHTLAYQHPPSNDDLYRGVKLSISG